MSLFVDLKREYPQLAVLIDPDKTQGSDYEQFLCQLKNHSPDFILLGGSSKIQYEIEEVIHKIKAYTNTPIILFPGGSDQLTSEADGLLLLCLISGRNPEFLISKHVDSAFEIKNLQIETIPTGYILIDGGNQSSASIFTNTSPLLKEDKERILRTAIAGELLGMKAIYLEAGSGALNPISQETIRMIKDQLNVLLLVGGGIQTPHDLYKAAIAGADIVVVGTAFEQNPKQLASFVKIINELRFV